MDLDRYIKVMMSLRIGRAGGHERPHKPALLLAILALADAGRLKENRISYEPELFTVFRRCFEAVRSERDQLNMADPFWRLRSDGLLLHRAKPGMDAAVAVLTSTPTVTQMREITESSMLPEELFELLKDPRGREALWEAIVARYFAGRRHQLNQVLREERLIGEYERKLEENGGRNLPREGSAFREQAFRRVVLRAYDYRCAACGLRIVLDDLVLVEAAHLVPWTVSRDDDPRNGMALCRNHHWAMDRSLIAPSPSLQPTWSISRLLDDRVEGQRDLLDLRGRSVLLPKEARFAPKTDALRWRLERLLRAV